MKNRDGYVRTDSTIETAFSRNGHADTLGMVELLNNQAVKFHINFDGTLRSIEGYDSLDLQMKSHLKPEYYGIVSGFLDRSKLLNGASAGYNLRVGMWLEKECRVDSSWTIVEAIPEYANHDSKMKSTFTIHWENKDSGTVRISWRYALDGDPESVVFLKKSNPKPIQIKNLEGNGFRITEYQTMRILKEENFRSLKVSVRHNGQSRDITGEERQTFTYRY